MVINASDHVYHQYTLKIKDGRRNKFKEYLNNLGIPSMIYYPTPLHLQSAYKDFPQDPKGLPNSEQIAKQVFSLPMNPYLAVNEQQKVINSLQKVLDHSTFGEFN